MRLTLSSLLAFSLISGVAATTHAAPAGPAREPGRQPGGDQWPTVGEQLAVDRVPAGSALARLIAANQQLDLLAAGEATDKLHLPVWLRVLWRRQHPEPPAPGDATRGYPLVLHEVREWMVHHPDLQPATSGPAPAAASQKSASVGEDLRISPEAGWSRSESDIRIDYWNPARVIAAANNLAFRGGMSVFYSGDGGATWAQAELSLGDDRFHSDPAVEWTADGTAWVTAISVSGTGDDLVLRLRAFRSDDGGATWSPDETISGEQVSADKQMVWTDHSAKSPFHGNLYSIYHNGRPAFFARRKPDGSWSGPIQISGSETFGTGIGDDIKSNALGHIFAFWHDTGSRRMLVRRSTNGGNSFEKTATIGTTFQPFQTGVPAQSSRNTLVYVTGGAYIRGKQSQVYAAWADLSGAPGCRTPFDDPLSDVNSKCTSRIWFSRSTNGGTRWTKPRMLNNPNSLSDQFNPWLVVDETTGVLGLIYYDTFGEERTKANLFYQSSYDGGVNWRAPIKVSSAPSDESDDDADANQYGDYNGLSAFAGTFLPSWTDRRDGRREQIWTAAIHDTKSKGCRTTDLAAAAVTGSAGVLVRVPASADETRLTVWHRPVALPADGVLPWTVEVDALAPQPVTAALLLTGGEGRRLPKGVASPVVSVVDLDAVCDRATGGAHGCRGHALRVRLAAPASAAGARWAPEDASVTSCPR
ncbi:MAG TPA: sialidase family protein [Thermoanaerobaculia bacterium]|jgi:hypothetical protein|nr:sialidase family protein [Thermoanaerobaculia bacterium]